MTKPSIVWFRQDLRIEDQPALMAAIGKGGSIIPLFVWAPEEEKEWTPGAASRWWLHGALVRLQKEFEVLGLHLIFRQQDSLEAILDIVKETGADAVFWNRRYEPIVVERDARIKAELHRLGIKTHIFNGSLLFEPWEVLNKQNNSYKVFTHFWNCCCRSGDPTLPLPKPQAIRGYKKTIQSVSIEALHLLPSISWDRGLQQKWEPFVASADNQLEVALQKVIENYHQSRDQLAVEGTTELSPYLHFGEISPRQIWHAVRKKFGIHPETEVFLRQLGWREFAYYLLFHFPRTTGEPLNSKFATFQWQQNTQALHAWQKGMTGYPVVDAGMRQLWQTGWMHNRARMIVGSFLVKDLLIDWKEGAKWFWDTLVDADLANNTLGWQWVAGCGADAAPYFRVFNPVTQGEKFDANGEYVRRWIPEIRNLPDKWIHKPWEASEEILKEAGVKLGLNYPKPIVDHAQARKEALKVYGLTKE